MAPKTKRTPKATHAPRPPGAGTRGPLPKAIDWRLFDALAGFHATADELASYFDVSPDTLARALSREKGRQLAEYLTQKRLAGRVSLRRRQFQLAMKGDRVMLIWLGKQYLGQADASFIPKEPPADTESLRESMLRKLARASDAPDAEQDTRAS